MLRRPLQRGWCLTHIGTEGGTCQRFRAFDPRTGAPGILRHDGAWERGVEKRGEQSGEQKGAIH